MNGVALARDNYMETDLCVTLFTRNHGKLALVANKTTRPFTKIGPTQTDQLCEGASYYVKKEVFSSLRRWAPSGLFPDSRESKAGQGHHRKSSLVRELPPLGGRPSSRFMSSYYRRPYREGRCPSASSLSSLFSWRSSFGTDRTREVV